MTSLIFGDVCCICLKELAELKSKNNRFKFKMMYDKTLQDVNLFLCDKCMSDNNANNMNDAQLINILIPKIHPTYKQKLMHQ